MAGIGWLCWCSLNLVSERVQRDPGRLVPTWAIALAPLALAGFVVVTWRGVAALAPVAVLVLLIFAYPLKARVSWAGPLGPVVRGLQTATLYWLGVALARGQPSAALATGLALAQVARSLLADIRDVATDTFELPRRIGVGASQAVCVGVLGLAVLVLTAVSGAGPAIAVLGVQGAAIATLGGTRSYELHMAFVTSSLAAKAALIARGRDVPDWWAVALAVGQAVLLLSYRRVPRPANTRPPAVPGTAHPRPGGNSPTSS